jgi:hypothetical protein
MDSPTQREFSLIFGKSGDATSFEFEYCYTVSIDFFEVPAVVRYEIVQSGFRADEVHVVKESANGDSCVPPFFQVCNHSTFRLIESHDH